MLKPSVPAWFEIPVRDLDRAQAFYEAILDAKLERRDTDMPMAVFPRGDKPNATGALILHEQVEPSVHGSTIYLHVDDLREPLARVVGRGGDTLVARTELPGGIGFFAQFVDSEGNRIGLFSQA